LAPPHIQPYISKNNFDEIRLLANWTEEYNVKHVVIPFVDVRFATENIRETIVAAVEAGCIGIKGAFIPEADRVLTIQGIPQALGISVEQYCSTQEDIFRVAHDHNLPLLYHINLSQHFDWLCLLLKKFPLLKINVPHLGYSLRRISDLLDSFVNAYTDPSYLIDLLNKNNKRYLSFIEKYYTKILSGSDAIIVNSETEDILSYPRYFTRLPLPDTTKDSILRKNACIFLALSE
jgi:predicted TIM-barrel fold metal-dependent hydrolase